MTVPVRVHVIVPVVVPVAVAVRMRRAVHMDMAPAARLEHDAQRPPGRKARRDLREQDERQQDLGEKTAVHALRNDRTVALRHAPSEGRSVSLGPCC